MKYNDLVMQRLTAKEAENHNYFMSTLLLVRTHRKPNIWKSITSYSLYPP